MVKKLVLEEAKPRGTQGTRRYVMLTEENDAGIKILAAKTGRHKVDVANELIAWALKNTTTRSA